MARQRFAGFQVASNNEIFETLFLSSTEFKNLGISEY